LKEKGAKRREEITPSNSRETPDKKDNTVTEPKPDKETKPITETERWEEK